MKRASYDALASLLVDRYQEPEALAGLMEKLGYGNVADWIRPGPPEVYARQLLMGLQRRGSLDQTFFRRLSTEIPDAAPQLWSASEELGVPPPAPRHAGQERTLQSTEPEEPAAADASFLDRFLGFFQRSEGPSVEESIRYQDSVSPQDLEQLLVAGRSVARVRIGRQGGPPAPETTGFLVAPELLAIPDFVVIDRALVARMAQEPGLEPPLLEELDLETRVDFGYGRRADGAPDAGVSIAGESVAAVDWPAGFALLRLETAAPSAPLQLSTDPVSPGDRLHLIHHPHGEAQRFGVFQCVVEAVEGDQVHYVGPTRPGSSGAPLLDGSLRVVSMAYGRAARGVRVGPSARAILDAIRARYPALWEEIRSAQGHLKTIDPRLDGALAEAEREGTGSAPMVIHLADEAEQLAGVPDLEVSSRTGRIVTALGSRRTVSALRVHPGCVAVEASLEGGALECAEAFDIIDLAAVHAPLPDGFGERGDHALVAIIDNGIDVLHPAFLDAGGKTRIVALWDQLHPKAGGIAAAHSPAGEQEVARHGLRYGKLYTADDLDGFIEARSVPAGFPPAANLIHGTMVASIAAGAPLGGDPSQFLGGVAPEAKLLVVRYDREDRSVGYSVGHIDALSFIDQVAEDLDLPVVVNISNGMNAGAHDGTSSVEASCDQFAHKPGRVIVKSAGNEGQKGRHVRISVPQGSLRKIRWRAADEDGEDVLEFWFPSQNDYEFTLVAPAGAGKARVDKNQRSFSELLGASQLVEMNLQPYVVDNGDTRLSLSIRPIEGGRVQSGNWLLEVRGLAVAKKQRPIDGWLEVSRRKTFFLADTTDDVTVTIPGTARSVLCVGAATKERDFIEVYERSSRGPTRAGNEKPDLVAPAVDMRAARAGTPEGLSEPDSGTSFAAPQVTGAVALKLSEWRKRHPDPATRVPLSFAQIRSAILDHSHPGDGEWDNQRGWGRLDVKKFFAVQIP